MDAKLGVVRPLFWRCAVSAFAAAAARSRRGRVLFVLPASALVLVLCYYSLNLPQSSFASRVQLVVLPPPGGDGGSSSGGTAALRRRLAQPAEVSFAQRPIHTNTVLAERNAYVSSAPVATGFNDSHGSVDTRGGLGDGARVAVGAASRSAGSAAVWLVKVLAGKPPPSLPSIQLTPPAASGAHAARLSTFIRPTGSATTPATAAAPTSPNAELPVACRLRDVHAQLYRYSLTQQRQETKDERVQCPPEPPNLVGRIDTFNCAGRISDLEALDFRVDLGGSYRPRHCNAGSKVAIIVPFRDRWPHLFTLLLNLHPFLQKQELQYTIFVINQADDGIFNKGILLNTGAMMASTLGQYDCYIFHDIDLLPENDNNIYRCPTAFQHLSVAVDKFGYELPYVYLVGGVLAADKEAFAKINGYSNLYYGWGGEDDDMAARIAHHGYVIKRYITEFSRYKMVRHGSDRGNSLNEERYQLLKDAGERSLIEGLRSQVGNVTGVTQHKLFTMVNVIVDRSYVAATIKRSMLASSRPSPN